jgi:hypothetical protein
MILNIEILSENHKAFEIEKQGPGRNPSELGDNFYNLSFAFIHFTSPGCFGFVVALKTPKKVIPQ